MAISHDTLLLTAAICLIMSLGLAWLASFILYLKTAWLKKIVKANHQLIRAHIDYILMCLLLVVIYYLCQERAIVLPTWCIITACIGALYNPFGFIVLAFKPSMANPESTLEKARVLLGFLPATIGFSYPMIKVIGTF
tara:strand:+ start:9443 stop:9856 length:414 start_codon:yes stop_codon:yes gene_type:complete